MATFTNDYFQAYKILLHPDSFQHAERYWQALQANRTTAGKFLQQVLKHEDSSNWTTADFLQALCATKRPRIFAESEVIGDGSDWNQEELQLLGDLSVAVPVQIYDNARHQNPLVHQPPFEGMLLYTAGALLRSGNLRWEPADWAECVEQGQLNEEGYYQLYARRLWPVFAYANAVSAAEDRRGLVTIPGLGCGQFAGKFKDQLGAALERVLLRFLED